MQAEGNSEVQEISHGCLGPSSPTNMSQAMSALRLQARQDQAMLLNFIMRPRRHGEGLLAIVLGCFRGKGVELVRCYGIAAECWIAWPCVVGEACDSCCWAGAGNALWNPQMQGQSESYPCDCVCW